MTQKLSFLLIIFLMTTSLKAQDLPYKEIPDYPADYTPGNVAARMIDGLGFRFYWATEGLRPEDLAYQPSEDARTLLETMRHIYGMSEMIMNAPSATPNERPADFSGYSYEDFRRKTLENLKAASKAMANKNAEDFESFEVIFKRGEQQSSFPYWNLINGMLSDCIYHTGQITLMRRSSGNPINPNVSVFMGRLRN
ncbi:hypothetical protein EW142_13950 [Flagellimonas allohymeniacidonis]|uniref:DinB family protein n=2 Tax=Flagellimonas allohymeniacidonis TaxID=2517819 RepID=A0A4Q8QJ23_9FLAO|nr:hypothetical protein EW142_13950 [Allomuricauda hymeniacidonis]